MYKLRNSIGIITISIIQYIHMSNTVLRNTILFYTVLIFILILSLINTFFKQMDFSPFLLSYIFILLKPILTFLLFSFSIILIYFFRNTMRSQQFFFSAFLLSSSILPILSSILEYSQISISTKTTIMLMFNFFYIIMLLFLLFSAIAYHYNNIPLTTILFFFILIISAVFVRYGLLISTILNKKLWYFLGGIKLFATITIIIYILTIVVYILGLLNFEVRKTVAYFQTVFLFLSIFSINIIIFSIQSPYIVLGATFLLIISLIKYLHGYFYHAL